MAISTHLPLSEVEAWTDREIATAWDLLDEYLKRSEAESHGRGRGRRPHGDPGDGGPKYSG